MTAIQGVSTVVVIPARNEADRIGTCLQALAAQDTANTSFVVVANNCIDETARIATDCAAAFGLTLLVVERTFAAGTGVGTARRIGCDVAVSTWPDAQSLLFTDADCRVAPDWITRNRQHLRSFAAVCGHVTPMPDELGVLRDIDIRLAELEGRYDALVNAYYRMMRPGPCGLTGDHGHAAGASLSVRAGAYRDVGGFADLTTGEDRDLIRRLKAAGHPVLHAGDVTVSASCRLDGRAQCGMSDALRARALRMDYLIDDGLPPAQHLIDAAENGNLGPWPLQVAPQDRLRARDLAPEIARLEAALTAARFPTPHRTPTPRLGSVVD